MVTLPVVPSCAVLNVTAPVKTLVLGRFMEWLDTSVVKLEVPFTVNGPI